MSNDIYILGIETSCDETSAAVFKNDMLMSNIISSQEIHATYGGVVPELASRAHEQVIVNVVEAAITKANITKNHLSAVAFTQGPGLMGALLVGTCFAKALSVSLQIPLVAVNHMKAHIFSHFIEKPHPSYPFLCLTVSGGHTQIVLVHDFQNLEIVGETLDDAVGEAFDKAAKMLNLPYPGGPLVDKYASQGDSNKYRFPIAHIENYNFSFSGVKTALLYFLRENLKTNANFIIDNLNDLCASYQKTLIDTLIIKFLAAAKFHKISQLAIAGGVSANSYLRACMNQLTQNENYQIFIPKMQYCTDNAAMVACIGKMMFDLGMFSDEYTVPQPQIKLT